MCMYAVYIYIYKYIYIYIYIYIYVNESRYIYVNGISASLFIYTEPTELETKKDWKISHEDNERYRQCVSFSEPQKVLEKCQTIQSNQ